jgi:hypothetical protein
MSYCSKLKIQFISIIERERKFVKWIRFSPASKILETKKHKLFFQNMSLEKKISQRKENTAIP